MINDAKTDALSIGSRYKSPNSPNFRVALRVPRVRVAAKSVSDTHNSLPTSRIGRLLSRRR